jgi:hypothetical protein
VPAGAPCPHCGEGPAAPDLTVVLTAPPVDDTAELEPVEPLRPALLDPLEPALLDPLEPALLDPLEPALLDPLEPALLDPLEPALPEPSPQARRPSALAVLVAAVALVLVAVAAVAGLRAGTRTAPQAGPGAGQPSAAVQIVRLPADDVRAAADSTQQPDGRVRYAASNTLDGQPETAWNSDGRGAGSTLVYTFGRPVDLRSITVRNGYQKVLAGSGGPVDLYPLNERVRTFTVITDGGSTTWTLRDDRAPQTLAHAFGRTRTVRLRVDEVYPSRKYKDLAVSEFAFGVAAGS